MASQLASGSGGVTNRLLRRAATHVGVMLKPSGSAGSLGLLQDTNFGGAMGGAGLLSTAGGGVVRVERV